MMYSENLTLLVATRHYPFEVAKTTDNKILLFTACNSMRGDTSPFISIESESHEGVLKDVFACIGVFENLSHLQASMMELMTTHKVVLMDSSIYNHAAPREWKDRTSATGSIYDNCLSFLPSSLKGGIALSSISNEIFINVKDNFSTIEPIKTALFSEYERGVDAAKKEKHFFLYDGKDFVPIYGEKEKVLSAANSLLKTSPYPKEYREASLMYGDFANKYSSHSTTQALDEPDFINDAKKILSLGSEDEKDILAKISSHFSVHFFNAMTDPNVYEHSQNHIFGFQEATYHVPEESIKTLFTHNDGRLLKTLFSYFNAITANSNTEEKTEGEEHETLANSSELRINTQLEIFISLYAKQFHALTLDDDYKRIIREIQENFQDTPFIFGLAEKFEYGFKKTESLNKGTFDTEYKNNGAESRVLKKERVLKDLAETHKNHLYGNLNKLKKESWYRDLSNSLPSVVNKIKSIVETKGYGNPFFLEKDVFPVIDEKIEEDYNTYRLSLHKRTEKPKSFTEEYVAKLYKAREPAEWIGEAVYAMEAMQENFHRFNRTSVGKSRVLNNQNIIVNTVLDLDELLGEYLANTHYHKHPYLPEYPEQKIADYTKYMDEWEKVDLFVTEREKRQGGVVEENEKTAFLVPAHYSLDSSNSILNKVVKDKVGDVVPPRIPTAAVENARKKPKMRIK